MQYRRDANGPVAQPATHPSLRIDVVLAVILETPALLSVTVRNTKVSRPCSPAVDLRRFDSRTLPVD